MATLQQRQLIESIVADGKVETKELQALGSAFSGNGKIDREEADLLVELFKRIQRRNPAFEAFFYKTVKKHLLADGKVDAERTAWLRQLLLADGVIGDDERKFLNELKGEASEAGPEFQDLFAECMKLSAVK